jgi:hypothetical protein
MGKRVLFLAIPAFACLVGLSGCKSSSEPSSDQARKIVAASYSDLSPDGFKITEFKKLNGEAKVVEGQKTYVYHFLAAVEVPAGIGWSPGASIPGVSLPGQFTKLPAPGSEDPMVPSFAEIKRLPPGGTGVSAGTITFRETENGWTADSPDIRNDGYCTEKESADACYKQLGWDKSS